MEKDAVTIVLFDDASLALFANQVNKKDFPKSARFFTCPDETPAIDICEWTGNKFPAEYRKIKEF